jgi:proteasome accessory factor A
MNAGGVSLFGEERELAVTATSPHGFPLSSGQCAALLFEQARTDLPHLPCDGGQGMFLATGGRFYPDSGDHPEITTPEVSHPSEIVRYTRAGEAILADLAKSLQVGGRVRSMRIFKHNANHGADGFIAWGTHESYLGRKSAAGRNSDQSKRSFAGSLIPFLVTRILFTGSGGFNSRFPGIEFLISPRVAHLTCPISPSSTSDRPIFHLRPESLTSADLGYDRIHLICGESNLGDRSLCLKFATTALVVAMLDADLPLPDLRLENPVQSMLQFARDWNLRCRARLSDGSRMSAIEIQRWYLAAAENAVDRPEMPPWTREAIWQWRAALDALSQAQVDGRNPGNPNEESLDWRIKHALFNGVLCEGGFTWKEVKAWNAVMSVVLRRRTSRGEPFPYPSTKAIELGIEGYPEDLLREMRQGIARLGLREARLIPFLRLRDTLQEIDIRLMEVGGEGLFRSIERAGCVRHRMETDDSIEEARHRPPSGTRASIRGSMIRRLHRAGMGRRFTASWEGIRDKEKSHRMLDLGDPFETKIRWVVPPDILDPWLTLFGGSQPSPDSPVFPFSDLLDRYDAGDYRSGWEMIEAYRRSLADSAAGISGGSPSYDYLRLRAWFAARLGLSTETHHALEQLNRSTHFFQSSLGHHADFVLALSNLGLAGHDTIEASIQSGFLALGGPESADAAFLSNAALRRLRTGDTETARRWLDRALEPDVFEASHAHTQARILAHRGECCRREGRLDEAEGWLRRSEDAYLLGRFNGDHADYCLPYRAKLDRCLARDDLAMERLERALAIQTGLGNPGQLRTRLLMAQIRGDSSETTREAVAGIARQFPAFEECPRFRAILEPQTWSLWCQGRLTGPLAHAV